MVRSSQGKGGGTGTAPAPSPHETIAYGLDDSLAYQLRETYKSFVHNLQPLLDAYEITVGMWYFLRALWEEDGLTQRQICERLGLVAPTTVEQLKNMERRGLLQRRRSEEDRRKIHVYLTEEGQALKEKLLPFAPYVNQIALTGLSPGEVGFLRLALAKMQQNLIDHAAAQAAGADPFGSTVAEARERRESGET